jgi:hypothetical protein
MAKRLLVALAVGAALAAGAWLAWRHHAPRRPEYVMINQTARHDFDLAFRMSLRLAEKKSGIENALVLLPALPPGKSIEETAADLFSRLRIGARRNGRGVLYLYSAKENLMKIEVSYALEGEIPDVLCRQLEQAARTYMLSEVPQDFISELIITTNLRGMGSRDDAAPAARPQWINDEFLSGGGGALVRGYGKSLEEYQQAIRRLPATQMDAFAPSADAQTTAQRYLASLAAGIGDPRLPLLTEGSRIFRAVVPRDEAQQKRIFGFLQSATPHRLLTAGDLALLVPQPGRSNLPVVLRRGVDGLWYVDEPKAWTWFHRFEDDVNFHAKYADNPFLPALRALGLPNTDRAIYGEHVHTPPAPPYPFDLGRQVEVLEKRAAAAPGDAAARAALGDLYLFEMNWITRAIEWYEKAEALAPGEHAYRWRLVDLYLNASRAERCLEELGFVSEHSPDDQATREWYGFYRREYADAAR